LANNKLSDEERECVRARAPSRFWFQLIARIPLILGGILPTLPVFGLWMLPLGLALIADDVPWLKCRLRKRYGSQSDLCQ
jgi:hypothetical protein